MKYSMFISFILSFLLPKLAFSQDNVEFNYSRDYESILKLTKDPGSEIFYEDLFKRFEDADSTLSSYEMVALQIGYTDNPNYWPYQDVTLEREIWSLNVGQEEELKVADDLRNHFENNLKTE